MVPLEVLHPTPTRLARREERCPAQLGEPTPHRGAGPAQSYDSPSLSPSTQRLPRAAAAPAAQKHSPSQESHQRAGPPPPPAAAVVPMFRAPLQSPASLPRPRSKRHDDTRAEMNGSRRGGGLPRVSLLHRRSLKPRGRAHGAAAARAPRPSAHPHSLQRRSSRCATGRPPSPPRRSQPQLSYRSRTSERSCESALLMRPPRPLRLLPSERQPMSRAGAGWWEGRCWPERGGAGRGGRRR